MMTRVLIYLKILYAPNIFLAVRTLVYLGSMTAAVSLFVFSFVVKEAIDRWYASAMQTLSFGADVSLIKESGIGYDVLKQLDDLQGVRAFPVIQRNAYSPTHAIDISLIGLDLGRELEYRPYLAKEASEIDLTATAFEPRSLLVTRNLASRFGLDLGSKISLNTVYGSEEFQVTGIVDVGLSGGPLRERLAFTSVSAIQYLFDDTEFYDRIDVVLESLSLEELRRITGNTCMFAPPSPSMPLFEFHRRQLFTLLFSVSAMGFLVSGFLIFNLSSVFLRQRVSSIRLLRALGVRTAKVISVLYIDSMAACTIAWIFGSLIGLSVSRALLPKSLELISSMDLSSGNIITAELSAACLALSGTLTFFFALLGNSLAVASNLKYFHLHMQGVKSKRPRTGGLTVFGAVLLSLTLVFASHGDFSRAQFLSVCCSLFLTISLLSPGIVVVCCQLLLILISRWKSPLLFMTAHRLLGQPFRAGIVVVSLVSSLAFVSSLQGPLASLSKAVDHWLSTSLQFDLSVQLHSLSEGVYSDSKFYEDAAQIIRGTSGVDDSYGVRVDFILFDDKYRMLLVVDHKYFMHLAQTGSMPSSPIVVDTKVQVSGPVVLVSENMSRLEDVEIGDDLILDLPLGERRFEVAQIIKDYSWPEGVIFVDSNTHGSWGDQGVSYINMFVSKTAILESVENELRRNLGDQSLFFYRPSDIRRFARGFAARWLGVVRTQKIFSVGLIFIGIAGFLVVSFLDQARDSAVLYALGASRRQLVLSFLIEIVLLVALGVILAQVFGYFMNERLIEQFFANETGYSISPSYTAAEVMSGIYLGGCSVLVASIIPFAFSEYMKKSQMLLKALVC